MKSKKILIVIGTRPNFIKVTQFRRLFKKYTKFEVKIAHTGQHYDEKMSDVFFQQFGLIPDFFLSTNPGTANSQIADIMLKLEKLILDYNPNLIMVVGDVNSTLAGAVTANKMGIPLAHIESGLRSFDRTMPEEYNRVIADMLSDYCFVTEQSGYDNLMKEGKKENAVFFVGNTMIDTLVNFADEIEKSDVMERLQVPKSAFFLMTMHRPATVDVIEGLTKLGDLINEITRSCPIVFPVHPRTLKNIENFNLKKYFDNKRLIFTPPLDYFSFQHLVKHSKCIVTDSGGIQEESTFLQVPCLTLRPNTERPVTVNLGTNELVPFDLAIIKSKISEIEMGKFKKGKIPPYWDGKATDRIVEKLNQIF